MSVQSDFAESNLNNAEQPTPSGDGAQSAAAADDLETLRGELAEIEQKADEYLKLAQRTQADFVNYRRRIEDERSQQAALANMDFVKRLLPVLDDFERAMAHAAPKEAAALFESGVLGFTLHALFGEGLLACGQLLGATP